MSRSAAKAWLVLAVAAALQGCSSSKEDPNATSDSLARGTAALEAALTTQATDDFLEAANQFSAAAALVARGAPSTQAQRDQARFFGALARIALLADPYSDLTPNGLGDLGDVLDAFGMPTARAARATLGEALFLECTDVYAPGPNGGSYYAGQDCQLRPLSPDSPGSGALQGFLADRVAAELRAAVALLEDVSDAFVFQLRDGTRVVELDKTDALFLKGVAQAMLATIDLQGAYDLDVDLVRLRADADAGGYTVQRFWEDAPLFLTLRDAVRLPQARDDATDGIRSLQAAVQHLAAETDDQSDDLVVLSDHACWYDGYTYSCTTTYNPQQRIAELEDALGQALAIATASGPYTLDMNTPDTSDDVVVDPDRFFAGVNLRALVPAPFTAGAWGDRPSLFPDTTFGGVLVSSPTDPNADLDGDGSPDLFGGYTYFGAYLAGRHVAAPYGSLVRGDFALAPAGTGFVFSDWNRWDSVTGYATSPGTWSYSANVLTLAFDAALPNGVRTVVVTAERIDGSSFGGSTRYLDDAGGELPGTGYQMFFY